jgi:hypothetical protein
MKYSGMRRIILGMLQDWVAGYEEPYTYGGSAMLDTNPWDTACGILALGILRRRARLKGVELPIQTEESANKNAVSLSINKDLLFSESKACMRQQKS